MAGSRISTRLAALEKFADDPVFQSDWRAIKRSNKLELAGLAHSRTGVAVDPDSLFSMCR